MLISHAFEDFAQSLRILLEADLRARTGLLFVDRAEAVGNIETGLSAVLNAFHSLYDSAQKEPRYTGADWYDDPALATILAIRNARHHNKARRIRTLYTYHVQEAERPQGMQQYVFVDYPSGDEGGDTFDVHLSWADMRMLLDLPAKESRLRASVSSTIRSYLGADEFGTYAAYYGLPEERVFFNVVPLLVNAGIAALTSLSPFIVPESTEAKQFLWQFTQLEMGDTTEPEVSAGPFVLSE